MVESKEFTNYAKTEVKKFIYEVGRSHGFIQCDKEKSITAIAKAVIREIGGLQLRRSPLHSSESLGAVERWHQSLFAQARSLRFQVELNYKVLLNPQHPVVPWLLRHSAWLLNRYSIHSDGLTSYQRRWERSYQSPLCEFSETIMFRLATPKAHRSEKFESKWFPGLWLGRDTESNEILAGTSTGVFQVMSIRRMTIEDRYNKALFNSFSSTPWNHKNDGKFYPQCILPGPP